MKSEICLAYCTFPSEVIAQQISEQLVLEGAIACANIFPPMKSIYAWNGQLQREQECAAIFKMSRRKQTTLKERIRVLHPYSIPALVFLDIEDGHPEFIHWVYTQSL